MGLEIDLKNKNKSEMSSMEREIIKRKIVGYTENGYFKYSGYVEQSDSEILDTYKYDKTVKKIALTYYPIKDNKEIVLLDKITNYKTTRTLSNSINKVIKRINGLDKKELSIVIDECNYTLELKDINGNTLYILKL